MHVLFFGTLVLRYVWVFTLRPILFSGRLGRRGLLAPNTNWLPRFYGVDVFPTIQSDGCFNPSHPDPGRILGTKKQCGNKI